MQKRKHIRHVVLSKDTACGLYDNWSGAGSVLEIELEKDVVLPLKFISSAWPDGGRGYSVANVYGICSSFWTDTVKQIAYQTAFAPEQVWCDRNDSRCKQRRNGAPFPESPLPEKPNKGNGL